MRQTDSMHHTGMMNPTILTMSAAPSKKRLAKKCDNPISMDDATMECLRLSSTGGRCYPSLETNVGYRDCSSGWEGIAPTDSAPVVDSEYVCSTMNNIEVCLRRI